MQTYKIKKKKYFIIVSNINKYITLIGDKSKARVLRGGSFNNASSANPVCYRNGNNTVSNTNINVGFRAVL